MYYFPKAYTFIIYLLIILGFGRTYYQNVKLDNLLPYPNGDHLDPLRTHRYVRDCQPIRHGKLTHESIKTKLPQKLLDLHYIKDGNKQFGHLTIVKDPASMLSVLEPLKPGSCKTRTLAYVTESAQQGNCIVATNAGYFSPFPEKKSEYGKCLGNIISDGKFVQDNNGIQNANFGIRADGTIVIGYLSLDEVHDNANPFVQLISGVGWVLRNGKIFLNESAKAECRDLETSGNLNDFFKIVSARTLIGYDKNGYVHLVQFDGKTNQFGMNLYDAARYMKSLGVINAINFDGGGSATYVVNDTIINYTTNPCTDPNGHKMLCPKNVSTIICIHNGSQNSSPKEVVDILRFDSNRNYVVVILLTVIIGILLLSNVFFINLYQLYHARYKYMSGSNQKKEALRSLLEERHSSELDSDEDEL